ncbi:MAG: zinc ribbon domain-containing protein [Desulfovibrio sp.]|nr:zinc ribbon domain-containing protein [Desulfovibrio sp.]
MPIYEYGCQKCGHEFEELVMAEEDPCCPACGSKEVQKMMSKCSHQGGCCQTTGEASTGGGGCHGCAGGHCATCGH